MKPLGVAIMAAGKGTRMQRKDVPKVCNVLNGRTLIEYVVDQARQLNPDRIVVIVGHMREQVIRAVAGDDVRFVVQEPQLGTAHAVEMTRPEFTDFDGDILVLSGDAPLLQKTTLEKLIHTHRSENFSATMLVAEAPDPTGYGRVIRTAEGLFDYVVEDKDATPEQRQIAEINSGIYVFDAVKLFSNLTKVGNDNAQKEYYLPDVLSFLKAQGEHVAVESAETFSEIHGINTVEHLQEAERILAKRREA